MIPVPAIVDAGLFETVQAQLDENRKRKRDGRRRPGWLLQGLVVCRQCGYAFYGKMARGLVGGGRPSDYGYYRCTGTDAHRFGGQAVCGNRSVRSDKLEQAVWQQVEMVLDGVMTGASLAVAMIGQPSRSCRAFGGRD